MLLLTNIFNRQQKEIEIEHMIEQMFENMIVMYDKQCCFVPFIMQRRLLIASLEKRKFIVKMFGYSNKHWVVFAYKTAVYSNTRFWQGVKRFLTAMLLSDDFNQVRKTFQYIRKNKGVDINYLHETTMMIVERMVVHLWFNKFPRWSYL